MTRLPKAESEGEERLAVHLRADGIVFDREVKAIIGRQFRFDFRVRPPVGSLILVEVEGGTWTGGRHTRGGGYESDCVKYNEAVIAGYRLLRFTTAQVKSGFAIDSIKRAIGD